MKPGDKVQWSDGKSVHTWLVKGVHLGSVETESLVELECLSHKPGWTGEWMTHVMMFVPEVLLRQCEVLPGEKA